MKTLAGTIQLNHEWTRTDTNENPVDLAGTKRLLESFCAICSRRRAATSEFVSIGVHSWFSAALVRLELRRTDHLREPWIPPEAFNPMYPLTCGLLLPLGWNSVRRLIHVVNSFDMNALG